MNFCGFFDVYNSEKNFFEKFFHFYLTYLRDNFEKILKIFFQARGLRPVANDGEFCTLSCAGVSSRLLKYFFSYFDLKIPIYKAKIEKKIFRGYARNYLYHLYTRKLVIKIAVSQTLTLSQKTISSVQTM